MGSKNRTTRAAQKSRYKFRKRMRNQTKRDEFAIKQQGHAGHRMCGRKAMYKTEFGAMQAGLRKYGTVMNTYHCPICGGWHLTHRKT